MTEKEKMLSGKLYIAKGEELESMLARARKICRLYNLTAENEQERRRELIDSLFEKAGKNCFIEPTFRCDYGCHIRVGDNFFANFDCIILDVNKVTIGDNVFFAPRVCIFTAGHPIDKDVRDERLEFGLPVTIGNSVWVGGGVIINPGVTIGDNVVIGSGSVVTKDIPGGVVAAGNPCRVLRKITDKDKEYWMKQREEYYNG